MKGNTMQERVNAADSDLPSIVVQYQKDLQSVMVGLEPNSVLPSAHFIDALYGGVPSQTKIGKIFAERMGCSIGNVLPGRVNIPDCRTSDEEAEWHNDLGRAILDAVTGSTAGFESMFTHLDRPGTNRLIRLLRKARDESFGPDA